MQKRSNKLTSERKDMYTALMELGSCYKSDMTLYMGYLQGNRRNGTAIVSTAKSDGLLTYRKIASEAKKKDYDVVTLSHKGKWHAVRRELYIDEDETLRRINASDKDFDTHDMEDLEKMLLTSRVKLAFEAVGIPAHPLHKPYLQKLYETITSKHLPKYQGKTNYRWIRDESFYETYGYEDCKELLKNGIFYTANEVRSFLEDLNQTTMESIFGTRMKGIYLSNDKLCMIYALPRGKSKNYFVRPSSERNTMEHLEALYEITNVYRALPSISDKHYNGNELVSEITRTNKIDAIVIGDTDALVPRLLRKQKTKSGDNVSSNYLTGRNNMFGNVYEVSFTMIGLDSLAYITSHSTEQWQEEMLDYFENNPDFDVRCEYGYFPALHKVSGQLATYMPVYECNLLEDIRDSDSPAAFVTYPDMVPVINKAIAKKGIRYFDIDTGEEISDLVKASYDKSGAPVGLKMVKDKLAEEKKTVKVDTIKQKAADAGLDYEEFCNQIEEGDISVDELVQEVETAPLKNRRHKYTERIYLPVDKATKKNVEDAARFYHKSIAGYVRGLIEQTAAEDAERYRTQKAEDKEFRKKLLKETGLQNNWEIASLIKKLDE